MLLPFYHFLLNTVEFYVPAYKTATQKNSTTPDLRTTIYWNLNLPFSEKGKATFDFYLANAGRFIVL